MRETVECLLNASTKAVNLVSESRLGNLGYTLDRFNFRFSSRRASGGGEFVEGDEANGLLIIESRCVVISF